MKIQDIIGKRIAVSFKDGAEQKQWLQLVEDETDLKWQAGEEPTELIVSEHLKNLLITTSKGCMTWGDEVILKEGGYQIIPASRFLDKEIIGYKVKDDDEIIDVYEALILDWTDIKVIGNSYEFLPESLSHSKLKKLKVLDLWCDLIYKGESRLPIINGYKGELIFDDRDRLNQ